MRTSRRNGKGEAILTKKLGPKSSTEKPDYRQSCFQDRRRLSVRWHQLGGSSGPQYREQAFLTHPYCIDSFWSCIGGVEIGDWDSTNAYRLPFVSLDKLVSIAALLVLRFGVFWAVMLLGRVQW